MSRRSLRGASRSGLLATIYSQPLSSYSGFGGHEANPHAAKPIGRLAWGSQVDGDYTPPAAPATTDSDPALSFVATPGEQAAGQALRVTLPEAAQEILFDISLKCPHAHGDLEQAFGVVIRVEMDVPLQRVETIGSANGKGRLAIERTTNSHGDDAGYASDQTAAALQTLANAYGSCPVNARLPSGRRSELTVTAISLPNGGHYDIARDWTGPHRNHRAGEDTDIGLSAIASNQARLQCLFNAITAAELEMPVSSEAIVLVNPRTRRVRATADHVHLWTGEQRIYDQDLTAQVQSQLSCLILGTCQ